jgi:hypothetical protein
VLDISDFEEIIIGLRKIPGVQEVQMLQKNLSPRMPHSSQKRA